MGHGSARLHITNYASSALALIPEPPALAVFCQALRHMSLCQLFPQEAMITEAEGNKSLRGLQCPIRSLPCFQVPSAAWPTAHSPVPPFSAPGPIMVAVTPLPTWEFL